MKNSLLFKKILFYFFIIFANINLFSQNVPPSITDPEQLRATQIERQKGAFKKRCRKFIQILFL